MKEAAGLLVIRAQLHHLRQELGGAASAQRTDCQQPLDPLILGESMLLKKVVLQAGVQLVIVRVGDCIEAQLDNLLAQSGDSVVESVPLLHHSLGPEGGLLMSGQNDGSVTVLWLLAPAIVE